MQALHPTPAVGGVPAGPAVAAIGRLEPEPRGRYAGPVGYVDATGDGRWMVGIRAMTIDHLTARLAAGVGIVAGSVPSTELAEANLKLTAVLDALAPGLAMPPVGPTPRIRGRGPGAATPDRGGLNRRRLTVRSGTARARSAPSAGSPRPGPADRPGR